MTKVVGVVGGGQLARMMTPAAINLGLEIYVLAKDSYESAKIAITSLGDHMDAEAVVAFARDCDVVTFDHEHVPQSVLAELVASGANVQPSPQALLFAQDKLVMRERLAELGVPVLPRGGGTSQCGQTTGAALVIDNTKYFRNVLDLNLDKGYVEVEPGIVLDHLNGSLKQHGLWYPVDVSTAGQATIGGMAGNNSCGSRSIAYGNMVHNVLGIDAWLADGQVAQFGNYANSSGAAKQLGDFVKGLAHTLTPEIEAHFPKVLRRVAGYNLDIFNPQSELPYTQDGSVNLAHLLVGSEGTLAYFKSLKLKLAPLPQHKVLGIVNFASFYKAMESAQHIVKLKPTAAELVDRGGDPGVSAFLRRQVDRRESAHLAAGRTRELDRLLVRAHVEVGSEDTCALADELQRDGAPDPGQQQRVLPRRDIALLPQ